MEDYDSDRREYKRQWYQANKRERLAKMKAYREENPEPGRAANQRQRAIRRVHKEIRRDGFTPSQLAALDRLRQGPITITPRVTRDHGLNRVLHLLTDRGLARIEQVLEPGQIRPSKTFYYVSPEADAGPTTPSPARLHQPAPGERPSWDEEEDWGEYDTTGPQ